jgi:hypothetical protein
MNERGAPTPVAWTRLRAPESLMAPADPAGMQAAVTGSDLHAKYATSVDRESAREKLAARLEAGAAKAKEEASVQPEQPGGSMSYPKPTRRKAPASKERDVVKDIINSPVTKDLMRTAAREIFRGVFGTGRR